MNQELSKKILEALAGQGVTEFCVCAGNRNSPLIVSLEASLGVKIYSFVDERSAAFFAIGRIHALGGKPVAVVMTSGTAVAECLPAVIEAYYQSLPLVIVSADRPRHFRGSGAPQAIEQFGIFGLYAPVRADVEYADDPIEFPPSPLAVPAHINVSFSEPLLNDKVEGLDFSKQKVIAKASDPLNWTQGIQPDKPLIMVGALTPSERPLVEEFLMRSQTAVWAESLSGLRGSSKIAHLLLRSGDALLRQCLADGIFKSVLRIGGVPTTRVWRDLEDSLEQVPVFSITRGDFTGLSRVSRHYCGFHHLNLVNISQPVPPAQLLSIDQDRWSLIEVLMEKYPRSEVGLLWKLRKLTAGASLYLGNSLPIREWDLVNWETQNADVLGNRGANGIDGQLSTFLGWSCDLKSELHSARISAGTGASWCLLGDLTTLYDLNAPWILSQLDEGQRNLVIINNEGGQIFRNFSKSSKMILPHQLRFKAWAEMWGASYLQWKEVPGDLSTLAVASGTLHFQKLRVIELLPDAEQSQRFNQEFQLL